jgi:hypothetical protein
VTALNLLTPLFSVFLGAGITYWLNVRARQRTHIEDLFTAAIAAVATVVASRDYISSVAPRPDLPPRGVRGPPEPDPARGYGEPPPESGSRPRSPRACGSLPTRPGALPLRQHRSGLRANRRDSRLAAGRPDRFAASVVVTDSLGRASRRRQEQPGDGPPARARLGSGRRVYAVGFGVWRRMWRSVISSSPAPWSRSMRRSVSASSARLLRSSSYMAVMNCLDVESAPPHRQHLHPPAAQLATCERGPVRAEKRRSGAVRVVESMLPQRRRGPTTPRSDP